MNKTNAEAVTRKATGEPGTEVSDEWLFQGYLEGHETCLAMLVRRYERELYSYLRRVTGDTGLAEDVFQNTFLTVHTKRRLYETGRPFRPWLYAIATNQAIDAMRRNKRHLRPSLDAEHDGGGEHASALRDLVADDLPDPLAHAEAAERRDLIRAVVDGLSEHLRVVVALSYYQGLKYKEIADILDIPVGTVKSRLHTAVRRLAEEWERLGLAP
jgi:RNA polymerase sigma-70 factor, ECF subfamily